MLSILIGIKKIMFRNSILPSISNWRSSFSNQLTQKGSIILLKTNPTNTILFNQFNQRQEYQRFFTKECTHKDPTHNSPPSSSSLFDTKTIQDYENRCEQGDLQSIKEFSPYLLNGGRGVQIDTQKAAKYYKIGSDTHDDITCTLFYAKMAENAIGFTKEEPEIASKYYKKAADLSKSIESYKCYLKFLKKHDGNDAEICKYLKLAADSGDGDSMFRYSLYLLNKKEQEEGENYLKKAVEKENLKAMNFYGTLISTKKPEESSQLFLKAIEKGSVKAMFNYANLLKNGSYQSLNLDKSKSFEYMKMAADHDFEEAIETIANWLLIGTFCKRNINESLKYYKKAADLFNNANSQYFYGYVLMHGFGFFNVDKKVGFSYIQKAANQDLPLAINELGCLYLEGNGIQRNDIEAAKCFKKAADLGLESGDVNYSICLFEGKGVQKNIDEAVKYLKMGVKLNDPQCMYNLGLLYMAGTGVEKNREEGEKLLKIASENGYEHALEIGDYVHSHHNEKDLKNSFVYSNFDYNIRYNDVYSIDDDLFEIII